MKKIILLICLVIKSIYGSAQQSAESMSEIYINKNITTHIIAGDPIKYVDISTNKIVGNQPNDNFVRLKPVEEFEDQELAGVITVVSERFIAQYKLIYVDDMEKAITEYRIPLHEQVSYINPDVSMPRQEMFQYAWNIFKSGKNFYDVSTSKHRLTLRLNNIYTVNDFIFLDVSLENRSRIKFDFDQIRIKIEDKKQTKATNSQSIELKPVMQVNHSKSFLRAYRNVFVLDKVTFPDEKVLILECAEKQVSGRVLTLKIDYADVLAADNFNQSIIH